MNVFVTVVSGVLVFVIGQIVNERLVKPINAFLAIVGVIDNRLKYYANMITSGPLGVQDQQDAIKILRELSCNLESSHKQLPRFYLWYVNNVPRWWSRYTMVPSKAVVSVAAKKLIFLHNSVGKVENILKNNDMVWEIRIALRIPDY